MIQFRIAFVYITTNLVDLWGKEWLNLIIYPFLVLHLFLSKLMLFTIVAHILKLAINQINLLVCETKSFSIDQLFEHLELVYYKSITVFVILNLVHISTKNDVFKRISTSLLGSQI